MVRFPATHLALLAALTLAIAAVWMFGGVPESANAAGAADLESGPSAPTTPVPAPPDAVTKPLDPPPLETFVARVRRGDTLSDIFERNGIPARDLQLLIDSGPLGKRLENIFPGYEFEFGRDIQANLLHLKYRPSREETVEFQRIGDRFEASAVVKDPQDVRQYRGGRIERTLFSACQGVGLNDQFATRLAEIFRWDIDFILDVRTDDEFHVLYNEQRIDNQFVGFGDILAVEFINQGETYRAVRYDDGKGGIGYYTPDGESMRKRFLRAPLDFSRISSDFNLKRIHPLWKSEMPHLGIDYAAPTGTPVKASGDGTVLTASKTSSKGNYIVIGHGERYQTKYLHLSRFARGIEQGKRVQQGQVIGYVGATGWATGPHLHYEFLVRGVHLNPRKALSTLPQTHPISPEDRVGFDSSAALLLAELDNRKKSQQFASLDAAR